MGIDAGTPPGLWERVRKIAAEEVAKFMRSGFLRNASITGGGLTIKGGVLRVLFPEAQGGGVGVFFGDLYSTVDGSYTGSGLLIQDADGKDLASFRTAAAGFPVALIRDSEQNIVLASNNGTGVGLARPWIPAVFYPVQSGEWPETDSTSFVGLHRARVNKQHSNLLVRTWGWNNTAGATGEVRVLVNGVQLGDVATTGNAEVNSDLFYGPVGGAFGDTLTVEIQGRMVSGTGTLQVGAQDLQGRN